MGRRRKDDSESVSLFPFLSVIACVIGTLTLIITAVAIGQIDQGESKEAKDLNKEYEQAQAELKQYEEEAKKLKQIVANSKSLEDQLAAAIAELEKLKKEEAKRVSKKSDKEKLNITLLAEANKLRMRIDELKKDPTERKKQLAELKAKLAAMKSPPKEAAIVIESSGSGINIDPFFVECIKNGIRLLDDKGQPFIRTQDLTKKNGKFHKLLDRIALKEKGTVILLLRPDAVPTYDKVRRAANAHYSKGPDGKFRYCPIGKLPVSTQGKIDLSVFRKK